MRAFYQEEMLERMRENGRRRDMIDPGWDVCEGTFVRRSLCFA